MPKSSRLPLQSLRLSVLALSLAIVGAPRAQAPAAPDPDAVRRLASDDPQVQASRWGALALMAGKPWLTVVPGEIATVWRLASWVVPGASMRFQRGFCAATACQSTDYVVQFDDKAGQLQFFEDGTMAYTGHVEPDGALRMKGTGLLGVLTAETLRHDPASGTLYANAHALKAGTAQQLAGATGGFAPAVAAAAHLPAPAAAAPAGSAPGADAELRAELEAMKAKVEQLSRQVEQQSAPAPAPARPLTAAEARAKAAGEKRQAEARAREERQAKAAEAQRLAAERKARAEEEKRVQAEARAREAEAKAAEAKRQAEERRALEDAARRQAEEQRARQEAERREAAERAREAEAARVREAEAARVRAAQAAARQQAAAQGPVRPGLYTSGTGYEVDVKLAGDALVLTERAYNRTSEYRPTSPGSRVYGYRNPNTGTHFALTVQNDTTLVASRFGSGGEVLPNGTPLRFAGGAAATQPVSRSTFSAMEERAQHYLRLAQSDPANAQAWSFCGMAAMAQAHGQNEAQVRQAATALKSIATTDRSPCGEVISDSLWRSVP